MMMALFAVFVGLAACTPFLGDESDPTPEIPAPVPAPVPPPGSSIDPLSSYGVAHITKEELLQELESKANILVVDTRQIENYNAEHIMGAVSVPLSIIREGHWAPPPNMEIVLYCGCPGEALSTQLALDLMRRGFSDVMVLKGDLLEWINAGYPTEGLPSE
jgi:rhodanese-related sulfurtransferase